MSLMENFDGTTTADDVLEEFQSELQELKSIAKNAKEDFGELGNDFIQIHKELFADFAAKVAPQRGTIVYTRLDNTVFHFGIYLGDNKIADKMRCGAVRIVSPYQFCAYKREQPILKIYCAANNLGKTFYAEEIADFAEKLVESQEIPADEPFFSSQLIMTCINNKPFTESTSFKKLENIISQECNDYGKIKWRLADLNFARHNQ
jgi:hypothetical protein